MKSYALLILLFIPNIIFCQTACIDPSQICKTCLCIMLYDPVCGCDGKVYGNSCFAYINGVTYWNGAPTSLIMGEDEICMGETVKLTALGVETSSYLWSTGETTSSIWVHPDSDTSYSVTVFGMECETNDEKLISVNPTYEIIIDTTIKEDEYYFAEGVLQNSSGIYYDTLYSINGCDSIIITYLTVKSKSQDTCFVTIFDTIYINVYDTTLVPIYDTTYSKWTDGFETYSPYTWPSSWTADANAKKLSANYVDNSVSKTGSNSLRIFGSIGGCWGALAYRPLTISEPFEIEVAVRNGNESLSGCHPERAWIGLRNGTSWINPARNFVYFKSNGTIESGGNTVSLGTYSTLTWYNVKVRYEKINSSNIKLSYWINDIYKGSEILSSIAEEDQLKNFELTVQEGTAWFDDIRIKKLETYDFKILDTIKFIVYDTSHVFIYDTSYTAIFDTLRYIDTIKITIPDTIHIFDTTFITLYDSFTTITEPPVLSINLYPNPSSDIIKINSSWIMEEIEIYNLEGKMIIHIELNTHITAIHISDYLPGTYILKVYTSKGIITKKLIIQ